MLQVLWYSEKFLWAANLVGSGLVAWRLYSLDLYKTYRFFFLIMVLTAARSMALLPFGPRTPAYYEIWVSTEPLLWMSYILVVYELDSLVLKKYQGIYSLGRWFLFAAVAISSIVALLSVMTVTSNALNSRQPLLYPYALFERWAFTSLAIFLFLLLLLVAWFSVPLSRNLLTHITLYSGYFFINNVILLHWHARGKDAIVLTTDTRLLTAIACFACWVFLLSRSGEERVASLRLGRSPLEERRLLGQLQTLNSTLLRTARK
jgi:hypothetical protein